MCVTYQCSLTPPPPPQEMSRDLSTGCKRSAYVVIIQTSPSHEEVQSSEPLQISWASAHFYDSVTYSYKDFVANPLKISKAARVVVREYSGFDVAGVLLLQCLVLYAILLKTALFIETTPHPGSSTEHVFRAYRVVLFPDHIFHARQETTYRER